MSNLLNNKQSAYNPERFFETDHLKTDLKGRSLRGGAVTLASQMLKFGLQTGGTFVLARLLAPADFGLIGMVTIILNFVELFKDLGLSTATIQKATISQAQVSTLFWINLALSALVTGLVVLLAPAITALYGEPRLTWIVVVLAGNFLLGGLIVQHLALLRRQMHFGSIAWIEIGSMAIGMVAAIAAAWMGAAYWALVIWRLVQSVVMVVGVWVACPWKPGFPQRQADIGSMLKFGGHIAGFSIVNYFSRNADNFLIGRFWGAEQLGLYAIAYKLLLMPIEQINTPITNVALPALSRLQNDPEQYRRYYYKALLMITTLGMPIVGGLFVTANPLIPFLLGPQWIDSIPIFQFLIPAAFIGTFNVAMGWVFISLGMADRQFRWGILSSFTTVLIFLVSVRWGAIGIAAAYGLSRPLFLAIGIIYCYHGTFLSLFDLVKTLSFPFIAATGSILLSLTLKPHLLNSYHPFLSLMILLIIYSMAYIGIWMIFPKGRSLFIENLTTVLSLRKA